MGKLIKKLLINHVAQTTISSPIILIRISVGAIFLSEGIQKFLFPESVGAGRFAKIGFFYPDFLAGFVGSFEIICGAMVMMGFLTRLAVVPLMIIMLVAIFSTKIPILIESGFWKMAHEARTDFSMFLSSLFLLIVGSGYYSLDRIIWNGGKRDQSSQV